MAFSTGTANSATELAKLLNTFLVANSWTNLDGETDIAPASPKTARYWRIVVHQTESTGVDYRELKQLEWRTTTGGANQATVEANYTVSSLVGTSDLVLGVTSTISAQIYDGAWSVTYDFGAGTIIRELVMTAWTDTLGDDHAPSAFSVQWSHDERTWTTMYRQTGLAWVSGETKTFTWDTGVGYTDSQHYSATIARRTGIYPDAGEASERNNDIWAWQGTGYDATRRVYIGCTTDYNLATAYQSLRIFATTDWDNTIADWRTNENYDTGDSVYHVFDEDPVTYWFYANTSRVVIVTKSGTDDYTASYLGFLAAFALPAEWAQPLYVGGTNNDAAPLSDASSRNSGFFDPGNSGCAAYFDWTNNWKDVENRSDSSQTDLALAAPVAWVWPWHTGHAGDGVWPQTPIGDNDTFNATWLDKLEPSEQSELPILPAIVFDYVVGAVGALDGVYSIPAGGLVTPEQTITLGADTYRVFPNRAWRNGNNYWAILEV